MKFCKLLFVSFFIVFAAVPSFCQDVNYGSQYGDLTQIQMRVDKIEYGDKEIASSGGIPSRSPIQAPTIGFDGQRHTLTKSYCQICREHTNFNFVMACIFIRVKLRFYKILLSRHYIVKIRK